MNEFTDSLTMSVEHLLLKIKKIVLQKNSNGFVKNIFKAYPTFGSKYSILHTSFFKIEVELIYNVVLVSGVQKSDSVIHIYILFQILFHDSYYKILNIVSCAIQ